MRLGEVLRALEPTGFSLRLWDDRARAEADFEVSARLARDASGRRLPAHGLPAVRRGDTTWEWSRYGACNLPTWTYRRAAPPPDADSPPPEADSRLGDDPSPTVRSPRRGDHGTEPDLP
jgi:hypothetical protein